MNPTITVTFRQKAESAVARSAQGILCIAVPETSQTDDYKIYNFASAAAVEASGLTSTNKAFIARAFAGTAPFKVVVVAHKAASLSADTTGAALDDVSFSWICSNSNGSQSALAAYAAAQSASRPVKACVVGVTSTSDHVMVLPSQTLTLKAGGTATMLQYASRIAAACAACPITGSVTYTALTEISGVSGSVGDNQTGVVKDDNVCRISKGIMATGAKTAVVEAKDIITETIINTFKNSYVGRMRNSAENQALFCSAIYGYLQAMAEQGVVSKDAELSVEIDVAAMRTAWATAGVDVSDLTDAQVKAKPIGSAVHVVAHLTILDCIEDLAFVVEVE